MTAPGKAGMPPQAAEEWLAQLGAGRVSDEADAHTRYGRCTTGLSRRILGALRPGEAAQLPGIVAVAARHGIALHAVSTGRNWGYGTTLPVRDGCVILDLSGLKRILDFDPETGLVTLEPGVTQGMLATFLEQGAHPFLVPVTGAGPTCSIVGNALERGYGITPHADHFGAVTSLEAVLADGSLYRSALAELDGEGLDRAFKWGIGPYVDGLFTQSGMGIVTRMTVALARRPESVRAFLFGVDSQDRIPEAVTRVREVLARYPGIIGAVNLMNARRVLAMSVPYPGGCTDKDGLIPVDMLVDLMRRNQVMAWTGFGTLYGSEGVVAAAQREIRSLLRPLARRLVFISPSAVRRTQAILGCLPRGVRGRFQGKLDMLARSLELVTGRPNETALPLAYWRSGRLPSPGRPLDPAADDCGLIWYAPLVPMKGGRVAEYLAMVEGVMRAHGMEPLVTLTSLSDRCFDSTVPILFDAASAEDRERAERCYWALLEAGREKGFLPYRVGIQTMGWLSREDATYWRVVRRIKSVLDPKGILSPGRYT